MLRHARYGQSEGCYLPPRSVQHVTDGVYAWCMVMPDIRPMLQELSVKSKDFFLLSSQYFEPEDMGRDPLPSSSSGYLVLTRGLLL